MTKPLFYGKIVIVLSAFVSRQRALIMIGTKLKKDPHGVGL